MVGHLPNCFWFPNTKLQKGYSNWDLVFSKKKQLRTNNNDLLNCGMVVNCDWMLFKITNKPNLFKLKKHSTKQWFSFILKSGWFFWNCDWMLFKSTNKANLDKFKKYIFSKQLFSFLNPFKQLQKPGPQTVPPCRPLHLQL